MYCWIYVIIFVGYQILSPIYANLVPSARTLPDIDELIVDMFYLNYITCFQILFGVFLDQLCIVYPEWGLHNETKKNFIHLNPSFGDFVTWLRLSRIFGSLVNPIIFL